MGLFLGHTGAHGHTHGGHGHAHGGHAHTHGGHGHTHENHGHSRRDFDAPEKNMAIENKAFDENEGNNSNNIIIDSNRGNDQYVIAIEFKEQHATEKEKGDFLF